MKRSEAINDDHDEILEQLSNLPLSPIFWGGENNLLYSQSGCGSWGYPNHAYFCASIWVDGDPPPINAYSNDGQVVFNANVRVRNLLKNGGELYYWDKKDIFSKIIRRKNRGGN